MNARDLPFNEMSSFPFKGGPLDGAVLLLPRMLPLGVIALHSHTSELEADAEGGFVISAKASHSVTTYYDCASEDGDNWWFEVTDRELKEA